MKYFEISIMLFKHYKYVPITLEFLNSYPAVGQLQYGGTFLLQFGAWEDVDLSEEI